jgi:hypothetical protein
MCSFQINEYYLCIRSGRRPATSLFLVYCFNKKAYTFYNKVYSFYKKPYCFNKPLLKRYCASSRFVYRSTKLHKRKYKNSCWWHKDCYICLSFPKLRVHSLFVVSGTITLCLSQELMSHS